MNFYSVVFSCVCAVLFAAVFFLFLKNRQIHKNIDSLAHHIDGFINGRGKTDFSTRDNHFALLQNSVSELEAKYLYESSSAIRESERNAEFIADISHQLKTPLAGMRLYAEMAQREGSDARAEKEIELVEKMESLIYKLVRLEKIKSDAYIMHFELCDAGEIASHCADEFREIFPAKQIKSSGSAIIRLDKMWAEEALQNIIKNACEHTAEDGIINISVEDTDNSVFISVSDNGGGVPDEELPKLFYRFHKTENASQNSSGLGLAITKAIAEKHHGTVTAENAENGLKVTICIPKLDGVITI